MNKHRREYHKKNPHKNAEYKARQRNKPERVEARAAARSARAAKKEAKQRALLLKRIHRLMVRHIKATAQAEAVKKILEESRRIQLEKELAAQARREAYERKLESARLRAAQRIEARQARRAAIEAKKAAERAEKQARASRRAELANRHGTTPGDYDRCRKLNGKACDSCKAVVAAYMRNKVKTDPRYKEHRRGQNRRRDKRVRRNGFEYYNTQDVLDRWGYDCHICKAPINFRAPRQCGDPGWEEGLHLDHVIPLAKGGPDTVDNVKPAHAKCNTDKRDLVYCVEEVGITSA